MFSIGDQIKVKGELDVSGQLLEDVYAETFAAQFGVRLCGAKNTAGKERKTYAKL